MQTQTVMAGLMWLPGGEGSWGRMDTCVCMAESLCCSPEPITTLLISYTLIENNFLKKEWKGFG